MSLKNAKIWFGLVSLDVGVETAVRESKETAFNIVCAGLGDKKHEPARTRQKGTAAVAKALTEANAAVGAEVVGIASGGSMVCPVCFNDERSSFGKGKEVGGKVIMLSEADLAKLEVSPELKTNFNITAHNADDLDGTVATGKVYWLRPDANTTATKLYSMFVTLLTENPHIALVSEFAIKSVPALYRFEAVKNALMIRELAWPETLVQPPAVGNPESYAAKELKMMTGLAESLVEPFDLTVYHDKRAEAVADIIAEHDGHEAVAVKTASKVTGGDLTSALELAIEAAKAKRDEAKAAPAKKKKTA